MKKISNVAKTKQIIITAYIDEAENITVKFDNQGDVKLYDHLRCIAQQICYISDTSSHHPEWSQILSDVGELLTEEIPNSFEFIPKTSFH